MTQLDFLKSKLRRGQVYRRSDLSKWSASVDRHLAQLAASGTLLKAGHGLYEYRRQSRFGSVPVAAEKMIRVFLKGDPFLMVSPNAYNALGVGTTQLYNRQVVYNRKRHGLFTLGGQLFDFRMKSRFPSKISPEFLFVDLLNNLGWLAEDRGALRARVAEKVVEMNRKRLRTINKYFSKVATRKFINKVLNDD